MIPTRQMRCGPYQYELPVSMHARCNKKTLMVHFTQLPKRAIVKMHLGVTLETSHLQPKGLPGREYGRSEETMEIRRKEVNQIWKNETWLYRLKLEHRRFDPLSNFWVFAAFRELPKDLIVVLAAQFRDDEVFVEGKANDLILESICEA